MVVSSHTAGRRRSRPSWQSQSLLPKAKHGRELTVSSQWQIAQNDMRGPEVIIMSQRYDDYADPPGGF